MFGDTPFKRKREKNGRSGALSAASSPLFLIGICCPHLILGLRAAYPGCGVGRKLGGDSSKSAGEGCCFEQWRVPCAPPHHQLCQLHHLTQKKKTFCPARSRLVHRQGHAHDQAAEGGDPLRRPRHRERGDATGSIVGKRGQEPTPWGFGIIPEKESVLPNALGMFPSGACAIFSRDQNKLFKGERKRPRQG